MRSNVHVWFLGIALSTSVGAQTAVTTTGGSVNTVPMFTGTATLGSTPITVSNGNIGIGLTSPAVSLDIGGYLHVTGSTSPVTSGQGAYFSWNGLTGGAGETDFINNQGGGGGGFAFMNTPSSGSPRSTLMFLSGANGNLGIGTTSPMYPLDVAGIIAANGVPATQAQSIALAADGTYQIAASGLLNGIYTVDWLGPFRAEHYQVSVVTHQFTAAAVTILGSSTYSSPPVLSNFRVMSNATGDTRYFVVDVANRNGGTGKMLVTAAGSSAYLSLSATPGGSTAIYNSLLSLNSAQSGNVGIGTTAPGAKLEVDGSVKLTAGSGASMTYQDGTVQTTAWNGVLSGGDYAESVDVSGDRAQYEPGDVLVIDPSAEGKFLRSSQPYSTAVMGIYSTKPGVVGRRQISDKSHMKAEVPMAMVGVVPTKVNTEGGAIKPGDLLVTSSTPGYAMRGSDRSQLTGAIIGKALGHLDAGKGVIEVAVSIQ